MATFGQVERICRLRNRIDRRVEENNGSCSLRRYWESATDNHFAISFGGTDGAEREQALVGALMVLRRKKRGLIVVISDSASLERRILSAAGRNGLGKYWCPSPESGYDLFYGLDLTVILDVIRRLGSFINPQGTGQLVSFSRAFFELFFASGSTHFSNLIQFAAYSDAELTVRARTAELPQSIADTIRNTTQGGIDLRYILNWLSEAFEGITRADCATGANCQTLCEEDALIFLRDRSISSDCFRLVVLKDIESAINSGNPVSVILDNVELTQNNYVREFLEYSFHRNNTTVGLCGNNLWTLTAPDSENVLSNVNSWVLFNPGTQQVDPFLSLFGNYQHHYPVLSGHDGRLFGADYSEGTEPRQRIRTQDFARYNVLLSGHANNVISLYEKVNFT